MMASAGSAHEGVGGEAEEAAEACTLNSLPEDVVIEHVLLLLPLPLIGLVARCTKRLSKLTQNPELWERLFLREMGENCSELTAASDWKSACLQLTSLRRMRWERVRKEDGAWPPARWGHTVTVLSRDRLMVFGGECNGPANDVHVLDVRETGCEWQLKRCSGVYPEARFGHSCVVNQGTAVIFGGSNGDTYFDDLQCLDVQSWRWWTPQTRGTPPSPRSSHSTTLCRNQAFVFGGIGVCGQQPNECLHDLVILDLETWCWSHPQVFGNVPQKRFVHRMVAIEEKLLLFGGRTSQAEKFNDLHWLDLQTMAWSKVEGVEGVPPSTRGGCTLVAIGNKAVMFGGRAEKDICLFDGVFLLHAHENPLRWHKVQVEAVDDQPTPRGAHGFGYMDGKICVFGGYGPPKHDGGAGNEEMPLDDLIFLRLLLN